MTLWPAEESCPICHELASPKHTVKDIPYYFCSSCHFLFNTYWQRQSSPQADSPNDANQRRRDEKWPAGEPDLMRQKGWEMMEFMAWPLAWQSRQAHSLLWHVPGYRHRVQAAIRRRLHKLLDFGCGHGMIVQELRERDHVDCVGLDPYSPTDSPYIFRQELSKQHFPDQTFDGIFAIETMEHIISVLPTWRELRRILRPGGSFIVQTRRLEDPGYRQQQDHWFYLEDPTTHVSLYSQPAMKRIAHETGWKNVSFRGTRYAKFDN